MEFIETYHEESDKSFPIPELEIQSGEEIEDFLQRERPNVIKAMAVALTLMIELETEAIPCFAIKDTDMVFNVHKAEAEYSLDQCIEYFTEMEEYEKCVKLNQLKQKL